MLVLFNMTLEPSNMRKKNWTIKYDKSTITCNVGIMWQWNYQMWGGKKKKGGTTEYDKSTVTYDVDIAQCEDRTIKCDTTECEKSTVKCYVNTAQCDNRAIKCEKK